MVSLLLVAALGACARLGPPAPVVQGTSTPPRAVAAPVMPSRAAPAAAVSQTTPGETVVRAGDSLYVLARRHNIPMRALIDANGLQPPYLLQTGQRLTLPQVRTYQVQSGDTLSGLARRFGLGTSEMVRANAIAPPYHIQVGQVLILPGGEAVPAVVPAGAVAGRVPPLGPPASVESAPPPVTAAAGRAPAPVPVMARTDPPEAAPAEAGAAEVEVAALPQAASAPGAPLSPVPDTPPVLTPPVASPAVASPLGASPLAPDADEPPPVKAGRGFIWPVRGTILSDYGSKPGGLQNDGINIAAPRGAPIRAAEGGTVVYAGNELRGFGNLLLVRHRDGWITAYAHADELLVRRGDAVRRGQVIARVGSSGGVTTPQLHFEVRRGSRHVNPRDYLAPQTAQAQ